MRTITTLCQATLNIRKATPGDVDFVLKAEADPENARGITFWDRRAHLEAIQSQAVAYLVIETCEGGRPVGFMIVCGLDDPNNCLELRRIIITEKRCGFGRAALQAVTRIAFEHLGAHRFWLDAFTDNEPAWRLYESEGFVREGVLRDTHRGEQGYRSLIILSILAPEYEARKQQGIVNCERSIANCQ